MNRYDLGWRQHLAFRWASRRTRHADLLDCAATIAVLLGLLLAYGIVGAMDYQDELRTEAEAQAARAERMTAEVGLCMEGRAVWKSADGKSATVCRPAEVIPL